MLGWWWCGVVGGTPLPAIKARGSQGSRRRQTQSGRPPGRGQAGRPKRLRAVPQQSFAFVGRMPFRCKWSAEPLAHHAAANELAAAPMPGWRYAGLTSTNRSS